MLFIVAAYPPFKLNGLRTTGPYEHLIMNMYPVLYIYTTHILYDSYIKEYKINVN